MSDLNQYIRALHGPILVTGSAGFVGANLFLKIFAQRSDVYAVVQSTRNWRLEGIPDENIVAANVNDQAALKHLIDQVGPRTVFDCVAYGAYSFEQDPRLIYETNFQSIINLTTLLADRPISAFIHAGSSSEYGTNSAAPPESARCEPNSHYAVSKVATAEYLRYLGKERRFPCINLRLYSVYGPLEDGSRLIPNLLHKALGGTLPPFVTPKTSRDFVHVDDVCVAFIYAAAKMNPELYGESLNIGSGTCTTIGELATITRDLFGVSEQPKFGTMEARSWDLADWFSDPSKARDMLGWQAKIPLEEGLKATATWVETLSDDDLAQRSKQSTNRKRRSISAIVACYKDEPAIPVMYQRLKETFARLGIDHEIIFVDVL